MKTNAWVDELRGIHQNALSIDWQAGLDELNRRLGLRDRDALTLSLPGLPPIWFNGDVEALVPDRWTLVFSLNHQVGDEGNAPSAAGLWDFCRTHNRDFWYPRFFRPLVRVASMALADEVGEEREYATTRMVFAELCPYASRRFGLKPDQIAEAATTDVGFQAAARVRDILVDQARPALVLVNGVQALKSFEAMYRPRLKDWHCVSADSGNRKLWHQQGLLDQPHGGVPVVGFPFLRTPRSHNSNAEIRQLGSSARQFLERHN